MRVLPGFDLQTYCRTIEDEKINTVLLVPTMVYALIDAKDVRAKYDLSSLATIIYGAAPMSPDRLFEGMKIFGGRLPAVLRPDRGPPVHHLASVSRSRSSTPQGPRLVRAPEPLVEVKLFDLDMNEVKQGESGRSACAARW